MKNLLKVFLMCFITLFAFAGQIMGQQKTITGRVVDALNEGMPGVNVQVKGTTSGTITNIDGDFSISVPNTKSVLVFTFIGYVKQEVAVGNQTKLNIQMKDDTQSLDEVVVVAYGTARKGDLTGALTTMRPDANEAAKAVSIDNLLEGKVAGLVVSTASSNPGAASSITIRGASSLRGDNQPLYVIDNIPQASTGEFSSSGISGDFQIAQDPLSSLNPADIEDITILKDASSTAIYGSRGANGVILITTKKGKEGKAKVNASATFTIANASRLLEMMNLEEYAAYHNSRITDGKVPFHIVGDEVRYVFNGAYDKYDPADPETYNVVNYRNWQKEIYTSAFSQNYSLSVNGGAGKTTYYISANFKDINGTVKQTGLKQGDLRANLSAQLSKSVDLNMALSGSLRQNNMMAGGNTLGGATGAISRTALDYAPFELPENDPSFTNENKTNVFSWLNDYVDLTDDKTFKASLNLNWKINKFFTYSLRAGGNINTNDRKRWYGMQLYQGMNNQGYLATSNLSKSNYSVENIVNYNTKLGSVGTLAATVGMTYDDYNFLNKNVIGKNFTMFEFRENGMHMAGDVITSQPIQKDYQLLSYLGRVNVSLLDKYLITASLRADGSSKFAKNNRWGYFPSASIAWRMEQEEFLKDVSWLNQLKLRFSYGQVGNDQIASYAYAQTLASSSRQAVFGDGTISALYTNRMANPDISWEVTEEFNGGLDLDMFNNRLNISVDLYTKKTKDMLLEQNLPRMSGFSKVTRNIGSVRNRGFEISVGGLIIDKKDFSWNATINFSANQSKVLSLGTENQMLESRPVGSASGTENVLIKEGYPLGLFYGLQMEGIRSNWYSDSNGVGSADSPWWYATEREMPYGFPSFADINGDGKINMEDRVVIGDVNPVFIGGLNTHFRWKFIELAMDFSWSYGNDIINGNIYNLMNNGDIRNKSSVYYKNAWFANNPTGTFTGPGPISWSGYMWAASNSEMVEDGSFLKMNNLAITCHLPKKLLNAWKIKDMSFTYSINNVFCLTKYSGYDPEVRSGNSISNRILPGVDISSYPYARSHVFSFNFKY